MEFGDWLCSRQKHQWQEYKRATNKYYYRIRKCKRCGVEQRKGNLASASWKDINAPFRWDWEKEEFEKSVIVLEIR